MCKSWCEAALGIVILVFALWPTTYSNWVIIIASAILIIHSFSCKTCFSGKMHSMTKTPARKR